MVPRRSEVASRFDVDLATADGTGCDHPARRGQHDRGRRAPDGRDRSRGAAASPCCRRTSRSSRRRGGRLGEGAAPGARDPADAGAARHRAGRADAAAQARPRRGRRGRRGPAGRRRHRGRLLRRRPVHPGRRRDEHRPAHPGRDDVVAAGGLRPAGRRTRHRFAPVVDATARSSGCSPAPARCARRSTRPPWTRSGRLRIAAAIGVNGDVRPRPRRCSRCGVDGLVVDTAHGHQERMLEALDAPSSRRPPHVPGGRRQRGLRRGRARPGRRRRRHRQGRRRARARCARPG